MFSNTLKDIKLNINLEKTYHLNLSLAIIKAVQDSSSDLTITDLTKKVLKHNNIEKESLDTYQLRNLKKRIYIQLKNLQTGGYLTIEYRKTVLNTPFIIINKPCSN